MERNVKLQSANRKDSREAIEVMLLNMYAKNYLEAHNVNLIWRKEVWDILYGPTETIIYGGEECYLLKPDNYYLISRLAYKKREWLFVEGGERIDCKSRLVFVECAHDLIELELLLNIKNQEVNRNEI